MDLNEEALNRQDSTVLSEENVVSEKHRNKKKTKITLYLTEEAEHALTELYIHRLRKDRKTDRSLIVCDAFQALYERECLK